MHAPAHRRTHAVVLLAWLGAALAVPAAGAAQPATPSPAPDSQVLWCKGGTGSSSAAVDSVQRNLRYRRGADPGASLWTGATRFASADMAAGYLGGLEGQNAGYDDLLLEVLPYLSLVGAAGLEAESDNEALHPLRDRLLGIGDGTVARALTVTMNSGAQRAEFAFALLAVRFDDVVLEYVARSLVEPVPDPDATAPPTALLLELETMARYFGKRTTGGPVMLTPDRTDCTGGLWDLLPAGTDLPGGRTVSWGRIVGAGEA